MKKRIITTLLIFVCTSVVTVMATIVAEGFSESDSKFTDYRIESKVLNETRKLIIKLPGGYNHEEEVKYPVVYVIGSSGLMSQVSKDVDLLNRTGHLGKMILVCVTTENAKDRRRDLTPPFLLQELDKRNSPRGEADKFLGYIEEEVIAFVDSTFNTSSQNLILGHSREGLFTMYSLLAKPQLFEGYIALSPALWRENDLFIDKMSDSIVSIKNSKSFLYMSIGEAEVEKMTKAFDKATGLLSMNRGGLKWKSEYTPSASHQTNHYLSATVGIVKFFDEIN